MKQAVMRRSPVQMKRDLTVRESTAKILSHWTKMQKRQQGNSTKERSRRPIKRRGNTRSLSMSRRNKPQEAKGSETSKSHVLTIYCQASVF